MDKIQYIISKHLSVQCNVGCSLLANEVLQHVDCSFTNLSLVCLSVSHSIHQHVETGTKQDSCSKSVSEDRLQGVVRNVALHNMTLVPIHCLPKALLFETDKEVLQPCLEIIESGDCGLRMSWIRYIWIWYFKKDMVLTGAQYITSRTSFHAHIAQFHICASLTDKARVMDIFHATGIATSISLKRADTIG